MRPIITDDVLNECENLMLLYTDKTVVQKCLENAYPGISDNKKKSVTKRVISYVNQGLLFLNETTSSIYTAPLTLFYAINNFSKAIFLIHNPNISIKAAHGIKLLGGDVAKDMSDLSVVIENGAFARLLEVTKDEINIGDTISLKDVLSIIPELSEVYYKRYLEEPNVFALQKDNESYIVLLHGNTADQAKGKDFSLVTEKGYRISLDGRCVHLFRTESGMLDFTGCGYNDVYGNEFITCGIMKKGMPVFVSKITSLYICYYSFSILVRYHPDIWFKLCESSDAAIIRKLMIHCRKEMMVEVLQLMMDESFYFSHKIENVDKRLDSKEIYHMVKKEYEEEKFRSGMSLR